MALGVLPNLGLIAPGTIRAADTTAPNSATTSTSSTPHQHHHRHKKTTSGSATSNTTVAPAGGANDSHKETAAGNTEAPDMSNSLGSNNPGNPNMGSADHTAGTTGTSGQ